MLFLFAFLFLNFCKICPFFVFFFTFLLCRVFRGCVFCPPPPLPGREPEPQWLSFSLALQSFPPKFFSDLMYDSGTSEYSFCTSQNINLHLEDSYLHLGDLIHVQTANEWR